MRTKEPCAAVFLSKSGSVRAAVYPSVKDCRADVKRVLANDGDVDVATIHNHRITETVYAN